MLLLLQRIFSEVPVLMLIVDASLVLEDFFSRPRILPIVLTLNSCSLWSSFGWSTMRNFSSLPLSIGPFHKVQCEVIYFSYVVRNEKLL